MRLQQDSSGFRLWLSANDTSSWANKPGAAWPCSVLFGKSIVAGYDSNGLFDLAINGRYPGDIPADELNACIADHLSSLSKDNPAWQVAVGQFCRNSKLGGIMPETAEKQTDERAIDQARAQLSSIEDMVKRLEHAGECTEDDCKEGAEGGDTWNNAEEYHDENAARQIIEEDALSVEVRTSWHSPGDTEAQKPDEYYILLCTGGPAVRATGGLSEHGEPDSIRLEYQDWFTPWELCSITSDQKETLLTYARCFYFGE